MQNHIAEELEPLVLATGLLSALDTVVAATTGRLLVTFEEHGIGLDEGRLLLEPGTALHDSRASRRIRSRMRNRGWLTADGKLTQEGQRLASVMRRATRAAVAEHVARMPHTQQLRLAAALHLMGEDLDLLTATADLSR